MGTEEADIYQSFSGVPNFSQEILSELVLLPTFLKKNKKSNMCPSNFKTISNQITSPVKMFNDGNPKF